MERKTVRVVTIGVVFCVIILLGYTAVITFQASRIERQASHIAPVDRKITKESHTVDDALPGERSLRDGEGWVPEDFFQGPDALRACEAILSREQDRLKEMIDSGLDVNLSGKAGMTLLCWAFVCGNLDAFKLLLESGADPDKRLTDAIILLSGTPLSPGDSILFTCMKQKKWQFFFAAFAHTRNVNQLDGGGSTLLHVATSPWAIYSVSQKSLQRLIDSGIDLDVQDKDGTTAALNAIIWERPLFCLQLLESGADPDLREKVGHNVADILSMKMSSYQRRGNEFRPEGVNNLQHWLETHGAQSGEQP